MSRREDARAPKVKNRAPAPVQITAEQLLREAQERQEEGVKAPRQRVEDFEELHEYRGRKRKEFEEGLRRAVWDLRKWTKYANWEASQNEFARARSVFERALDVEPTNVRLWLSYTDMELKARNVQHARNLYDRGVTLLPRLDQLWYKYVYLEELLGNVAGSRQVFERWMAWEPDEKAWSAYIKLEIRYKELDRASALYERLVACHPDPKLWIKWAKFEEEREQLDRTRQVFQMAFEFFGDEREEDLEKCQSIYTAFAKTETKHKEYERAESIYKFVLERLPRSKSSGIYASYSNFQKQFGQRSGVEATVLGKRRIQYEEELSNGNQSNYDVWFEYARLEEDSVSISNNDESDRLKSIERVREVYERAVAQAPPVEEKRFWRRYIFLWLNYATFEEVVTKDFVRTRQIFDSVLKLVPHKRFTFSKIWCQYAWFEIRRLDVAKARKIMGTCIGIHPKPKSFKCYIELEEKLIEVDRCRQLYEKFVEFNPEDSSVWIQFALFESELGDEERCRALFELAIQQLELDMPEVIWKAYITFEEQQDEWEKARQLYERLLQKTGHVKVWVTYAQFELHWGQTYSNRKLGLEEDDDDDEEGVKEKKSPSDEDVEDAKVAIASSIKRARSIFVRAYDDLRSKGQKESRVAILEAWENFERQRGDPSNLTKVQAMKPRTVRKLRTLDDSGNKEEYFDIVFPDDEKESNPGIFKLRNLAHAWKSQQSTLKSTTPVVTEIVVMEDVTSQ